MKTIFLAMCILAVSGCASFNAPSMSPEQLKEATKDKGLAVACLTFTGTGGSGQTVIITYDQRAIANGGVAVDPRNGCAVNLTNMAKPIEVVGPTSPALAK